VSIAYVEDGVRTLGAVYDPAHDELFHARRGGGAFRTDAGGETRIETAGTRALSGAMIAVGHSDRTPEPRYLELRRALMNANAAFRNFGSAALQLAHVADGRLDAYVEFELSSWDAMAGLLWSRKQGAELRRSRAAAGSSFGYDASAQWQQHFRRVVGARAAGDSRRVAMRPSLRNVP
jgi:myo-inositol-1(or 4)-monophosphatase